MEDDILDIVYKIQEKRSPKLFLWKIIKELKLIDTGNPDHLYLGKGQIIIFSYNKKTKMIVLNRICGHMLINKFNLTRLEVRKLVWEMTRNHIKINIKTGEFIGIV